MLVEMWSPAFKEAFTQRPSIRFTTGLNVIKGATDGANSIGKSSLLLAIDFAFSGSSYLRSGVVEEVGHHTNYFTFRFDNQDFRFARSTSNPSQVSVCDENWKLTGTFYNKDQFGVFLAEKYGVNLVHMTWNQMRTSFFRIYGKKNFDEQNPLLGWPGENRETSLKLPLDLFGKFNELQAYDQIKQEATQELGAYKQAQHYKFIPSYATKVADIENEQQQIETLQAKREQAIAESRSSHVELNAEATQQRLELRQEINQVERDLVAIDRRIGLLEVTRAFGIRPDQADLDQLQAFFPEADIRAIAEVEQFHLRLADVLKSGAKEDLEQLGEERRQLLETQENLRRKISELGPGANYSLDFLEYLSEIDAEIGAIKARQQAGETFRRLEARKQSAISAYKNAHEKARVNVEQAINARMAKLTTEIVGHHKNPPVLEIADTNSYSFRTPHDNGAGTGCRGLVIYDLAMLQLTPLPAVAHDSDILKRCDDESIDGIMEQFARSKKQVFLAFDRASRYTDRVMEIVEQNTVIELDRDAKSLYGRAWNRKN